MFRGHMSIQFDPSRDQEETPGAGTECSMFEFEIRYQAMAMLYKCLFRLFFLPEFCHKLNDFCLQKRPAPRLASLWYKTCLMNWDITVFWPAEVRCVQRLLSMLRSLFPCPLPFAPRSSSETDGEHFPRSAPGTEEHRISRYCDVSIFNRHRYVSCTCKVKGCSQQWLVLYQYFETSVCKDEPCF